MKDVRHIVLFETDQVHDDLLPLSFTRPVADFRIGIDTIREKWEAFLPGVYSYLPVEYLREKFIAKEVPGETLYVAGNYLPDDNLVAQIARLEKGQRLICDGELIAACGDRELLAIEPSDTDKVYDGSPMSIHFLYDIFLNNAEVIRADFRRMTRTRKSLPLSPTNTVIGSYLDEEGFPTIFVEPGAEVEGAIINVKEGPIYIGKDAQIMEGAALRGPIALCDHAKVNMGSKIYGGTTFGPYCKIGGEVNNAVVFGYSNKAHDGFLGNAVVGEWCNIGAGTNASNLKNDYSKIRLWNYPRHTFMRTDLQFCGLMMGDHSKAGINCMFNTATVVGVGCNIHGSGFPRVFIPSFSEGSPAGGFADVSLKKFFDIAARVMSRRDVELTEMDKRIFERVYEVASRYKR